MQDTATIQIQYFQQLLSLTARSRVNAKVKCQDCKTKILSTIFKIIGENNKYQM